MRAVTAAELDAHLDYAELVEALELGFSAGMATPLRQHHAIGEGADHATMLVMPAWTSDAPGPAAFLGTKIVNVFPGNGSRGLPAVLGSYILMSGETGAPLAVMDGTRLTQRRTAAVSALAARFLARTDASRLTLVGAGALAPCLARAHASQRQIRTITVWNHRPDRAEALAHQLAAEGFEARASIDLETAVAEADIVSCATLSTAALVKGAWLRPGTHLDLVGAFTMSMREADDDAIVRGSVFVDTEAARTEGGDIALALRSGAIAESHVRATLAELCRSTAPGRRDPAEITVFKAVGTGLADLTAAILAWKKLASA